MVKIKASSLVETIVSLVIIMTSFGIGLMIFLNITKSTNTYIKIEAYFTAKELLIEAIKEKDLNENEFNFDNFSILKKLTPYNNFENLRVLSFTATNQKSGKFIIEIKQLINVETVTIEDN